MFMKGNAMSDSARRWMVGHPVESFFLLGILICFGTLFPAIYLVPHDAGIGGIIGFYLGKIGVYSPVLAGMLITRIVRPGKHLHPFSRRLKVSLPVYLVATAVNIASLKLTAPPTVPFIVLVVLSLPVALLPAWVCSSAFAASNGIREMLATLIRPRGKVVYYVIALLTFPVVHIAGTGISNGFQGSWLPTLDQFGSVGTNVVVSFVFVIFFAGGINEESGWRGFAQRRLQAKFSPLAAAVILWFGMVIWHIPNDIIQYQYGGYVMIRIVMYVCITVLFTWTYNRTHGSILAVVLFHASMNSMNPLMGLLPVTTASNLLLIAFAVTVVFTDRMWRTLPEGHPAVYRESTPA